MCFQYPLAVYWTETWERRRQCAGSGKSSSCSGAPSGPPSARPGGRRAEVYYTTSQPFLDPKMKQNIMETKGFGTFWGPGAEVPEPEPRAPLGKNPDSQKLLPPDAGLR